MNVEQAKTYLFDMGLLNHAQIDAIEQLVRAIIDERKIRIQICAGLSPLVTAAILCAIRAAFGFALTLKSSCVCSVAHVRSQIEPGALSLRTNYRLAAVQ